MSQPSQDRSSEPAQAARTGQVLPFERPVSELQRAVQMRAQESMERQRARAQTKPNPVRRIAMFALALIPVALLFFAVDSLLRVFHHINAIYNSPANAAPASAPEPVEESPPEPGVVLLQPLQDPNPPAKSQ